MATGDTLAAAGSVGGVGGVVGELYLDSASSGREENFPVLFHMATQDHALPDLLWNQVRERERMRERERERERE